MHPDIKKHLGLKEDATDAECAAAVKELVAKHAKLSKDHDELKDKHAEASKAKAAAEQETATLRASAVDVDKFVPRSIHDAALARLQVIEDERKVEKAATFSAKVETVLSTAMRAGKVTPAEKADYVALCSNDDGLAKVEALLSKRSGSIKDPLIKDPPPASTDPTKTDLTAEQRTVMAKCGLTEEQYRAGMAKTATARREQGHEEQA